MGLIEDLRAGVEFDIVRTKRALRGLVLEMPRSFEARILMGDAHLRSLHFDLAATEYRAALGIDPKSGLAFDKLALCAFYSGRYHAALEGFRRLLAANSSPRLALLTGLLHHRLGQPQEALARYAAVVNAEGAVTNVTLMALQGQARALREVGQIPAADVASKRLMQALNEKPGEAASSLHQLSSSFDYHEWSTMADKAGLALLLRRAAPHVGNELRFPATFVMPEDRDRFLARAAERGAEAIWIVKPLGAQGGQSIGLTQDAQRAAAAQNAVVQEYISDPYLVDGRKAHLRIYVLVTAIDPLRVYVYQDGIVRFAPRPYAVGPDWLSRADIHVTNTALHRANPLLVVNTEPDVEDQGHVWSLRAYLRRLATEGVDRDLVFDSICRLAGRLVEAMRQDGFFQRQAAAAPKRSFAAKLFGLDVLLDREARPWLIEIQRSPAWGGTPMVSRINGGVADAYVRMSSAPLELAAGASAAEVGTREEELERRHADGFVRVDLAPSRAEAQAKPEPVLS